MQAKHTHRHQSVTSTVITVECDRSPAVPFTVILRVPSPAFAPSTTVRVAVPAPCREVGFKVTVWALPFPELDRVIVESKPSETVVVIVTVPVPPLETVIDVGDALMAKLGVALVTFRVTVAVSVVPPAVPVTVIL